MASHFTLFKRISVYGLISIGTSSISFFLLPLITKFLSAEDYGILSVFNAVVRFFAAVIPLGMGHLLIVYIFQKKEEYPKYFSGFLRSTFIFSVLLAAIIALASIFKSSFWGIPAPFMVALPFVAYFLVFYEKMGSYFIYTKALKRFTLNSLGYFFLELALIILLVVIFPFNWKGRVSALVISLAVVFIANVWYCVRSGLIVPKVAWDYSKELIVKGFPLLFMGLSIMILNLSDRFFVEYFWGLDETGYYGIASTVAGILLAGSGALINTIRPQLFEVLATEKMNSNAVNKLTFLFIGALTSGTLVLYFANPLIFTYMVNEKFARSEYMVAPLIFGLFFWGIFNYFLSFLMYNKRNRLIGLISLLGILVNLVLNYVLIQKYKTIGAAYATLFTYIFIACVTFFVYIGDQNKATHVEQNN